jgi:tRNA (mo5U34)-methyltransferase
MNEAARIRERVASVPYWYHQIEVAPGIVTPGGNESQRALLALHLPDSCHGQRALDIGARDGFFSFELERRGADVLAIDRVPPEETGFAVARELLGSRVAYQRLNVYDLDPAVVGEFDIVLFLGVLYHLRNPLLALDRVRGVCRDRLWVETQLLDNALLLPGGESKSMSDAWPALLEVPLMQFYPGHALRDDPSNWWAPNMACLRGMLAETRFVVDSTQIDGARGIARCHINAEPGLDYYSRLEGSAFRP